MNRVSTKSRQGQGIDSIGADYVWQTHGFTGAGVKVGVVDDGMDCYHSDLTVWGGYNFQTDSPNHCGSGGVHGTKAAGVIAALDNTIGVVGVAPGAKIYSLKVCDESGDCDYAQIIDALFWSAANGMQVVSVSIGDCGSAPNSYLEAIFASAVSALFTNGVPVVVGHGSNVSCTPWDDPSSLAQNIHTIAVAGHDSSQTPISVYQYGEVVYLSAPAWVKSLSVGNGTAVFGGVSSAVPHVSGAMALLIEAGFSGVGNLKARLRETAIDLGSPGHDNYYGWGIVRAAGAVVPRPSIVNFSWCTGGSIVGGINCNMTATTSDGAGAVSVRFVAYYSDSPGDSTVYDFGSTTRSIYVPAGDYTLTIKTRARDAYGRFSAIVNTWQIPVCPGENLLQGYGLEVGTAAICD